jgi:Kef-type K+ transport system membrane component KefB
MLIAGYGLGKVAELVRLPEITGFIIAGILIGPYGFAVFTDLMTRELAVLTEVALAFLAFTVGGALKADVIRRVGKAVAIISAGHLLVTGMVVGVSLLLVGVHPAVAVLLGAIAGASSPGTTVALVQRERAGGPFVEHLFGVIAVVNVLAIIVFGVLFEFSPLMFGVGADGQVMALFTTAVRDVFVAIILGIIGGAAIHWATRNQVRAPSRTIILATGLLFISTAIAVEFGFSPLLMNMAAGAAFVNFSSRAEAVFRTLEPVTPPIYALFFVLAGTKFQLSAFAGGGLLLYGIVYIASRLIGTYWGVRLAGRLGGVQPGIGRNIGWCLVPQAGVALGLVLLIEGGAVLGQLPPLAADTLRQAVNIVLMAIFVKEIVGPVIASVGLRRGVRDTVA